MAATVLSRMSMNPDEDFVMHGRSTAYWERRGYLSNSELTQTTARLSQHSMTDPSNIRGRPKEKTYARSMVDLANNLEVLGNEVDETLVGGKTLRDAKIDREIQRELEFQKELRENIKADQFTLSAPNETLKTSMTEDELLQLYEDHVGEVDSLSGKPRSPRDAQWYVNPNHLSGTTEAPTLQSIGRTYRYGEQSKSTYSDKDKVALDHFPVTLGSSYEMCALDYPASEPMNSSAPPSMRRSRSKSAPRYRTFRAPDRSFSDKQNIDKMFLMTKEAPVIGSSSVYLTSPHQLILGKLRLERLRLEEAKLLETKRKAELERTRGPKPKWYMSKGPDFHYESHKNLNMIRSASDMQDILDYREDVARSSREHQRKYPPGILEVQQKQYPKIKKQIEVTGEESHRKDGKEFMEDLKATEVDEEMDNCKEMEEKGTQDTKLKETEAESTDPKPYWYMSKGPDFHYEAHKNTNMIRSLSFYQDMLDYREDLLRSSYENLKKYTRQPLAF